MPVDGSILAHASDGAISGTNALIQQYTNANPGMAFVEGQKARQAQLIAAYNAQREMEALELQKQQQAQAVLEQNRRFTFDQSKEANLNTRANHELAVTVRGQDLNNQVATGNLAINQAELALQQQAAPTDIAYKNAMIDQVKYGMDPNSPENQLRLANANKANQEASLGAQPSSPEGKVAADIQNFGDLAPTILAQIHAKDAPKAMDVVDQENKLRQQFLNQNKDYFQVADSYKRISAAGRNPSAAGDLALIFNFMKMLDPGSTVREGEFANAQNSGGVDDKVRGTYNQIMNGKRLSPKQRADFLSQSTKLYSAQREGYNSISKQYTEIAGRQGLNAQNIIIDVDYTKDAKPSSPQYSNKDFTERDVRLRLTPGTSRRQYELKVSLGESNG